MGPDSGVAEILLVLGERLGWFLLRLIIAWATAVACAQSMENFVEKLAFTT